MKEVESVEVMDGKGETVGTLDEKRGENVEVLDKKKGENV